MNEYKIMIVDDEPDILDLLEKALTIEGLHNVLKVDNGNKAVSTCREVNPDVIILDVMLPDIDGYEVCKQIRQFSRCPILFLSSKNDEVDKILGLAVGGDDYVTKPFRPLELIARVKAQLRRYKKYSPVQTKNHFAPILVYKKLTLNTQTYECKLNEIPVSLTPTEFSILRILLEKQGTVVSLEDLFHMVWKDEYYSKNSSTITVHVRHLREKLKDTTEKPQYIKTVWGVGYKI